jgi:mono/diheme cytochrome c family protein
LSGPNGFLLGATALLALVVGCDDREIREWRPEDHDPPTERAGQVAAGGPDRSVEILYARLCASCHGPDGRGSNMPGIRAPDLRATEKTDAEMVQSILRGRGRMPGFADSVSEEDARDLVGLVRRFAER